MLHDSVWASMVDLPATTPILTKLFGAADYAVIGAGGDLCLPGAIEYQHLHSDFPEEFGLSERRLELAGQFGIELRQDSETNELTEETRHLILEKMAPLITINFAMSELTWENGPIRQIPGHARVEAKPAAHRRRARLDALLDLCRSARGSRDVSRHSGLARCDPQRWERGARIAERRVRCALVPFGRNQADHAPRDLGITIATRANGMSSRQGTARGVAQRRWRHAPFSEQETSSGGTALDSEPVAADFSNLACTSTKGRYQARAWAAENR